ncbi:MAG: isoaspartyl peptidase/L-asparaginase [Chitinophagaceae bacterium]|nr:isoaspartyl peptidase/L-asparaginase [Chitinophagaceae bacterium]MBK7679049.1 isoaspartyl peptidase/L-asparaginase [Chitinophagaceae bacterium]MBK8299606.1 isoaspartyl peptidase/L-asparaginase [Chitinophagaceae bacterium]MBK9463657.1 isoaspartyl peptidase/L-asparaginase [Chitinophagaceae bacterium]MBK9937251.1 isoaspartyl peptidase/L-asparaginase [Chitinophagaceae bacterium]
MSKISLVIHGGAGTILRSVMTPDLEKAYLLALQEALEVGYGLLENGGSSLEAVKAAVMSLEDCILFNAGKGSVFAKDGSQEMDASIMEGKTLMAGAVSAVRNIRNPVELAYTVMTKSQHVMLNGKGAYDFAILNGIKTEPDDYFFSPFRYDQWKQMQDSDEAALDHNVSLTDKKFGTVGAAALDKHGNIAAATSTGGMTNKQFGRVGDSPIIGAGTYANNKTCAISCTGHGEPFIRAVTAYDVSCLMEYKGLSLEEAMNVVVHDKLIKMDGEGGMIGVDANGNTAMVFNSEGMYRGMKNSSGKNIIAIYK